MRQFYERVDFSGQRDPVTGLLLCEIDARLNEEKLIRRSRMPMYTHGLRDELVELHDRIMRLHVPDMRDKECVGLLEREVEEIVADWTDDLRKVFERSRA